MPKAPRLGVPEYVDVEPCSRWIECLHGAIVTSYLGKNSPMRYNVVQNHAKKRITVALFVIEHYKAGMTRKELLTLLLSLAEGNNLQFNENSLKAKISEYRAYRKSENLPL